MSRLASCYGHLVSLEAIAIVNIPYATLCKAHGLEPSVSAKDALAEMATFVPVGADATACMLDVPFDSSPQELAEATWGVAGAALSAHTDERGLLIVPDKGFEDKEHASYAAAVAHYGDVGQWVPRLDESVLVAPGPNPFEAMMGGGLGGTIAQIQSQLAADPRMAGAMGGGGGDLFQMAQQMLAQMSPDQQAQLESMAKQMFGNLDPSMLAGMQAQMGGGAPSTDDGDDPEFGDGDDPEFGDGSEPKPSDVKRSK